MPERRCPHCKKVAPFSRSGGFIPFTDKKRIVLEVCQNDRCHSAIAVIYGQLSDEAIDIYPRLETGPDEELPPDVRVAFRQALRSYDEEIWDGCVLLCHRALAEAMIDLQAQGDDLYSQIDNLVARNKLTHDLRDWARTGRLASNLGANGLGAKKWSDRLDAEELVEFCKWFFRYVYVFPEQIGEQRRRFGGGPLEAQPSEMATTVSRVS